MMMDYALAIVTAVLLLAGAFFALVAAIGIARLPDLYTRMHAASKACNALPVTLNSLQRFRRCLCSLQISIHSHSIFM